MHIAGVTISDVLLSILVIVGIAALLWSVGFFLLRLDDLWRGARRKRRRLEAGRQARQSDLDAR